MPKTTQYTPLAAPPKIPDDWRPNQPDIVRLPVLVPEGRFAVDDDFWSRLNLDRWWRQASEPRWNRPQIVQEGQSLTDPARLLDSQESYVPQWLGQFPDPPLPAPARVREGLFVWYIDAQSLVVPETTVLSWFQPTSQPLARPRISAQDWFATTDVFVIPVPSEVIGEDSIQRPTIRQGGTHRVRINLSPDLDEDDTISVISVEELLTADLTFSAPAVTRVRRTIAGELVLARKAVEFFLSGHRTATGTYRIRVTFSTVGGITDKVPKDDFVFDVID